ncbi:hypothetical protein HETIRDRAFT_168518 [Heterobasidion irregulare TC 32-1]|uniref:Uncharacterized protein n=1 Tax=Heterobasidion irregulare (strain TC 32-1) TaxID=747525 RepID=W4KIU3_HETIT|nr:uncharacterized protein HETIRDRAFT_168518 [Heterobasidion irregulare TC 32-1]ETW85240.1 hypothetical protein HETIRDRAFT_168518 [Heterobasidion irregulare TC 32-1]
MGEVAGQRSVAFVMLWRIAVAAKAHALTDGWCQRDIGDPQLYKASPFSPLSFHHALFLPTTPTPLILSHALHYLLSSLRPPSSVQVIRHDRLKHDVKLIGTIAFKHDSKFTGRVVSSGDTALGSVALVCGIGLYRSLEVASMFGCWCVSSTCLGSVLPVLLILLLFLPLVVLVSYHYLLRFDVLGCGLLALCCVVCSLWVPVSLCSLFDLACLLCLACSFSSSPCLLSWPSLFLLIAVACFLCFTWSSLSPFLAVALILVSDVSCQSLLVSVFVLAYLNLIFLLVYLVLAVIHSRWPWSISATLSISLASLRFLSLSFGSSWRPSQPILVPHRQTRLFQSARDRVVS